MSELVLLVVGLILCFAGARSFRLTVLVAGFGASWLLADAFDASTATTFLVAVIGAVAALVVTVLLSRTVLFIVGFVVGAVVGARLFGLLGGDDPSWILAVLFVPAFGFVCAFFAQRMGRGFLRWGTAIAGASLILSALGSLFSDDLGLLEHPDDPTQSTLHTIAWVVLAVAGYQVQRIQSRGRDEEKAHAKGS
jgi:hypothetical protein